MQFTLARHEWDKEYLQISVLTVHRSGRGAALQRLLAGVSGERRKGRGALLHLNLLTLDRLFHQEVLKQRGSLQRCFFHRFQVQHVHHFKANAPPFKLISVYAPSDQG